MRSTAPMPQGLNGPLPLGRPGARRVGDGPRPRQPGLGWPIGSVLMLLGRPVADEDSGRPVEVRSCGAEGGRRDDRSAPQGAPILSASGQRAPSITNGETVFVPSRSFVGAASSGMPSSRSVSLNAISSVSKKREVSRTSRTSDRIVIR